MIFLLNYDRVRAEVIELTRLRILANINGAAKINNPETPDFIAESDIGVDIAVDGDKTVTRGWSIARLPSGMRPDVVREMCINLSRHIMHEYLEPRLLDAQKTALEVRRSHEQSPAKAPQEA